MAKFETAELRIYSGGSEVRTPRVAFDRSGRFLFVWEDRLDGLVARFFQRNRQPIGGEVLLVANEPLGPAPFRGIVHSHKEPELAAGPDRSFFLFWTEAEEEIRTDILFEARDVLDQDVWGQHFAAGGRPTGPPFRLDGDLGFESRPAAARSADGLTLAVWQAELEGESLGVWGRFLDAFGRTLADPFRIDEGDVDAVRPAVAMLPDGRALVAWEGCCDEAGDLAIFGRLYGPGGMPGGPPFVINATTAGNQRVPAVSADASGVFLVVWHGPNGEIDGGRNVFRIYAQEVDRSGRLGREAVASGGPGWAHSSPAVTFGARGEALVAWMTWSGDFRIGIWGRRLRTGSPEGPVPFGPAFQISENPISGLFKVGLGATPTGRFLVSWEGFDADGTLGINARLILPGSPSAASTCAAEGLRPKIARVGCPP